MSKFKVLTHCVSEQAAGERDKQSPNDMANGHMVCGVDIGGRSALIIELASLAVVDN